jgi:hypothetical protein
MIPSLAEPLLGVVRSQDPSLVTNLHLLPLYPSCSQFSALRTGIQPVTTVPEQSLCWELLGSYFQDIHPAVATVVYLS